MSETKLTYVGHFDEVEVDGLGVVVRGVPFACSAELAGQAPVDEVTDDDGNVVTEADLGSGLLAQVDNFRPATPTEIKKAAKAAASEGDSK